MTLLRLLCTVTQPTGYKEEAERLAQAGVLVDTFFLSSRAADPNFVEIANLTKGTAYSLNICTAAGAQDLIDAVTPRRAVPTLDSHTSIGDERNCGRTKKPRFYFLPVNVCSGHCNLMHVLCMFTTLRILLHVGGASDGSKLVGEYQKRYKMRS